MSKSIYLRMAKDGIMKNRKLYVPFFMTSIMLVAVLHIIRELSCSKMVGEIPGGGTLGSILVLGVLVLIVFAAIFLFYTNSFLIRKRKKEFGLYNMLGMNKGSIAKVLFWETFLTYLVSVIPGTVLGVVFSKLGELVLGRIIDVEVNYSLAVDFRGIGFVPFIFLVIFACIMVNSLRQIGFSSAIELVKSDSFGEKPPKANYLLGGIGLLLLVGAYFLAVSIQQPLSAFLYFFIAVIMVIIGSYLVFISGSVVMCRMMQKNKKYYYKKSHFISVSSMAYRMNRNGAGLASICILLTMALVAISSTSALYFAKDECLHGRLPNDVVAYANHYNFYEDEEKFNERLNEIVKANVPERSMVKESVVSYAQYSITGYLKNSEVSISLNSQSNQAFIKYNRIAEVNLIDEAVYNRMTGEDVHLNQGDAIVFMKKTKDVADDLKVGDVKFHVVEKHEDDALAFDSVTNAFCGSSLFVIIPDMMETAKKFQKYTDYDGSHMLIAWWYYMFDIPPGEGDPAKITQKLMPMINEAVKEHCIHDDDAPNSFCSCIEVQKYDYLDTFGGLFFIALMLGIIFLISAVLIIYYKQLSEGYEDKGKFAIMQKVGMTKEDIRKTINSQMLTVFLLPIAFAVVHTAFAFPMVYRLLMLFGLFNLKLLLGITAITIAVITLIYIVIYKVTSNTYYSIVTM